MKILFLIILLFFASRIAAQSQLKKVLFLGNSYTYVNNLPQMVADISASTGNTLIYDINAPGGYYLGQHLTNSVSLSKIQTGTWDNVVLQDQSMALAYPGYCMNSFYSTFKLDSTIKSTNFCSQTIFYSTWGRKNGDSYICSQPYCEEDTLINRTFYQMNSDIQSNYHLFADSLKASMSPVSAVFAYIRMNFPSIELFNADESHPSLAGTYAAACCFYSTIFRNDPLQITFNSGLSEIEASNIRNAVKIVVYEQLLSWNIGLFDDLLDSSCLSLNTIELTGNKTINIYPNPVEDVLTLQSDQSIKEILLFDFTGKKIDHTSFNLNELNVSLLQPGIYIVQMKTIENEYLSTKFIKK